MARRLLADTMHLGTLEQGAYILLLMHYWRAGVLPNDDGMLARITRMSDTGWTRMSGMMSALLTPSAGACRFKRWAQGPAALELSLVGMPFRMANVEWEDSVGAGARLPPIERALSATSQRIVEGEHRTREDIKGIAAARLAPDKRDVDTVDTPATSSSSACRSAR